MPKFVVTTYREPRRGEIRAHEDTSHTLIEQEHLVEAETPVDAIRQFPEFCGPEVTSKSQFLADAHSQVNPRRGTVGVAAKLA